MSVDWLIQGLYIFSAGFLLIFMVGLRRLFTLSWAWPLRFFRSSLYICICLLSLLVANQLNQFFPVFPQKPILIVSIQQLNQQQYRVTLNDPGSREPMSFETGEGPARQNFLIHGDQFALEMRILSWHPILAEFGMNARYRLERLNGRYFTVEDEIHMPRTLYDLTDPDMTSIYWQTLIAYLQGSLVHAYFGSSVYAPMANAARYGVFVNTRGLELKALNSEATAALKAW